MQRSEFSQRKGPPRLNSDKSLINCTQLFCLLHIAHTFTDHTLLYLSFNPSLIFIWANGQIKVAAGKNFQNHPGLFWVTGKWFILWISHLKYSHQYGGLLSELETRTLCSCQLKTAGHLDPAGWRVGESWHQQSIYGPPKMLWGINKCHKNNVQGHKLCKDTWFHAALNNALTWRWKEEKWMSGMKRTGWVSKSVIILKMVMSLRFWRMGTLTSTTRRERKNRESLNQH